MSKGVIIVKIYKNIFNYVIFSININIIKRYICKIYHMLFNIIKSCYYNTYFHYQNEPGCFGNKLYISELKNNITGITIRTKYKAINFGLHFNESLDNVCFCEGVEIINFGWAFNKSLDTVKFPSTLKKIILGKEFNQLLTCITLPDNFELIEFYSEYNELPINNLPFNLKKLKIRYFYESITNLPTSLEELHVKFYKRYTQYKIPHNCIIIYNDLIVNDLENNN